MIYLGSRRGLRDASAVGLAIAVWVLRLFLFANQAEALDRGEPASRFLRTEFTAEDGLTSNTLNDILQTRDGFLWVGTSSGLLRFDGRHFDNIDFLPSTVAKKGVRALAEAPDGALWVGTDIGVARIPKESLHQFGYLGSALYRLEMKSSDSVKCLRFTHAGVLWVGASDGLYRLDNGSFLAAIPNLSISSVEEAANGHLLVAGSRGFYEWDGLRAIQHADIPDRLGVPAPKINQVFEDHTGTIWFSSAAGVAREVAGSVQQLQPYGVGKAPEARRVYEDRQGNIWVVMVNGLFRATAGGLEPVTAGLQPISVTTDSDGNLWVGTNGQGLVRFKHRSVWMFTMADGLPSDVPAAVLAGSDGKLWVGSNCGGLSWFDGRRFQTLSEKEGLVNSCVSSLAEDANRDLWIGTYGGGVFRLHGGRFTEFSRKDGLAGETVRDVLPASDGSLWIATTQGLTRMRDSRFHTYTSADGLSSDHLIFVHEDKQHVIWAGSSAGINRFTGDRFKTVTMAQGASAYTFMRNDAAGHLYAFDAPQGIIRIEGNRLITVADSPRIGSMAQAGKDIWFCGDGIYRAASDAFERWEQEPNAPQEYVRFGRADGMKSAECNTGSSALAAAHDGKVWTATAQGLAMIDSARLPRSNRKPRIYMRQTAVGRAVTLPGDELEIPAGTHHVELNFGVVELASPEKTRLQYRMDGVDEEWLDAGPSGRAIYTNLPPGPHKFLVRGCNAEGVWDRGGIEYDVTQEPFFYETRWFRYSMGGLLFVLLAAAYQFRLHRLVARLTARFEERLAERSRLERDLQDTLMQTIHGTMVIAESALGEIEDPIATRKTLEKLSQWLTVAMQESRTSLKALRNSQTPTNRLVDALQRAGEECVSHKRVEISLAVEGTVREMHALVRDEVYQLGAEAIRSACNRSGCTMVEVELSYGRDFSLRVSDNGKVIGTNGVPDGQVTSSSLQAMQERAAHIGGKLRVISAENPRTEIELVVPGRCAFTEAKTEWLSRFRIEPPV